MSITGGFGITIDFKSGVSRKWVMGPDGVKRWADNGQSCLDNQDQVVNQDQVIDDKSQS